MPMQKIGEVSVDSGVLMIGDPSYSLFRPVPDIEEEFGGSWVDLMALIGGARSAQLGDATAVTFSPGNGVYSVYTVTDATGKLTGLTVLFS